MIIGKHFEFEAAHSLPNDIVYGDCANMHGHSFKLTIEVSGEPNDLGWVIIPKELKQLVKREVIDELDNSNLNKIFAIPTPEHIAMYIQDKLQKAMHHKSYKLYSITLYETSTSYVKIIC